MPKIVHLALLLAIMASCDTSNFPPSGNQEAYVPISADSTTLNSITVEPPRATTDAGKIYVLGSVLFQNELNKGIHIIDNSDRTSPKKLAFLSIPYSTEISIKGKYLYTNNVSDLVVFDISNITKPQLVKRMKNAFPIIRQDYPPFSNVSFVCPDPAKGIVVGWELKTVSSPKCRR